MKQQIAVSLAIAALFWTSGCAVRRLTRPLPAAVPSGALRVVPPDQIPDFTDDMDTRSLDTALRQSLAYYRDLLGSTPVFLGENAVTVSQLRHSLEKFRRLVHRFKTPAARRSAIQNDFIVYQATGSSVNGNIIFSAYYEHTLPASFTRHGEYLYPLYAPPAGLNAAFPYYTREQIDSGNALRGKNLEIAWAKDPFDVYLLQVEGSGWLQVEGGPRKVRVRYDGSNNLPYRSIGLSLIQRGLMTSRDVSVKGIRSYLNAHPEERQKILNINPRYIFFRLDSGPQAPWTLGSLLSPLTRGRSVATDPLLFPRGALGWITTQVSTLDDKGNSAGTRPLSRFILNQDEGGAIKGPARVDLFMGGDADAAEFAGRFWQAGRLYFLVEKVAERH